MRSRKRKNGEARMEACGEIILPIDKKNIEKVLIHKEMLNGELPKYIEKIKPKYTEKKSQTNRPPHNRHDKANRPQRRHRSEEKS